MSLPGSERKMVAGESSVKTHRFAGSHGDEESWSLPSMILGWFVLFVITEDCEVRPWPLGTWGWDP